MAINERTTAQYAAVVLRGQWCNLCGVRLANKSAVTGARAQLKIQPTVSSGEASTWSLCAQCYRERLRCATCGSQVGARAFMLEGETRIYCERCYKQRPRCDTCGRPVGLHYQIRPDGRQLCDRCQATAISDPNQAHQLYRRVRAALAQSLGMNLREPCQLKLAGRDHLLELIDKSSLYSLDADSRSRCFGLFIREGSYRAIFVEYGLPQIVLLEVVAHEYAHAWQSENCWGEATPTLQEGFAEWVVYKLLEGWGCNRRSERMLRREDLYGQGLKQMLDWEREWGQGEVFRRVRAGI